MKSAIEIRYCRQRESAEALVKAELGDDALEVMCSFSHLDCAIDVKLKANWIRYILVEGADGGPDKLRRIS